jgi:hypothetical protein
MNGLRCLRLILMRITLSVTGLDALLEPLAGDTIAFAEPPDAV